MARRDEFETAQEIGHGERKEVWKAIAGLYGPEQVPILPDGEFRIVRDLSLTTILSGEHPLSRLQANLLHHAESE